MRSVFHAPAIAFPLIIIAAVFFCVSHAFAGVSAVHAFYLKTIPEGYDTLQTLIDSFKDSGADTLLVDMPFTENGDLDRILLPNMVFLAHRAGFRLFIIMPARAIPSLVERYPDWEDMEYRPDTGSFRQSGKLDLFNRDVVAHLSTLAGEAASFFIDGVLLADDFAYGPFEGMSRGALADAEGCVGAAVRPRSLYQHAGVKDGVSVVEERGELFHPWTECKRNKLLDVLDSVARSVKSSRDRVALGIAVPIVYPVANRNELLMQYALDMTEFKNRRVDYYWTVIHDGIGRSENRSSFRQFREIASRSAQSVISAVRDRDSSLIVILATTVGGKALNLSEIEEITGSLRSIGDISLGYELPADSMLPHIFTRNMFNRSAR